MPRTPVTEAPDNDHDDEDDAEIAGESEADDEGEAAEPIAPSRPRAKRAGNASAVSAGVEIGRFGAVPADVTHWHIKRKDLTGEWSLIGWARPGALVEDREFPLAELSEETIADRWGPGLYRVEWIRQLANGGRNVLRGGREVRIVAPPPAAPAPAASPMGESFAFAMQIMNLIEKQSDAKIQGMATMMQMMGGGARGLGASELTLILQNQAQATAQAITAAVAPLHARLDALATEDDDEEDDDDDDEPGAVETVAKTAGSKLFKGNRWWQQVGQYLTENPQIVKEVAPAVIGAVQNVSGAIMSAVAAPPQRPRAQMASVVQLVPQPLPPQPQPAPVAVVEPAPVAEIPPPPPVNPLVEVETDEPPTAGAVAQTATAAE